MDKKIESLIESIYDELVHVNQYIFDNPELGNEEFKACKIHTDLLEKYDFHVEKEYMNIETAYRAVYDSKKEGPTIAFMSEYDALPEIGHGCGHNLIGSISLGSAITLRKLMDTIGGKVLVLGTPAEEVNGAKVDMADGDVFDDIDVVLMAHPANKTQISIESLAMEALQFEFVGKTAHAAACPEKGINALDGVIATFNSINALRQHVKSDTRIHGIITKGGVAANIVPELAIAQFYVRSTTKTYLSEVVEKVKNCARGAALATGASLKISNYEKSYDNFISNDVFNQLIEESFIRNGVKNIVGGKTNLGSLDAGNVSQVCPVVHPMFSISDDEVIIHSREFANITIEDFALDSMRRVIKSFVEVSVKLINEPKLIEEIKECFINTEK